MKRILALIIFLCFTGCLKSVTGPEIPVSPLTHGNGHKVLGLYVSSIDSSWTIPPYLPVFVTLFILSNNAYTLQNDTVYAKDTVSSVDSIKYVMVKYVKLNGGSAIEAKGSISLPLMFKTGYMVYDTTRKPTVITLDSVVASGDASLSVNGIRHTLKMDSALVIIDSFDVVERNATGDTVDVTRHVQTDSIINRGFIPLVVQN